MITPNHHKNQHSQSDLFGNVIHLGWARLENNILQTDDDCEFELQTIEQFRVRDGQCQINGTNEGKLTGALELCQVSYEYWVDCLVDLGIEETVKNMKILEKSILKKLKKLKLPNTHRLRFGVADNVNCLIKNNSGQVESVRAGVTDTDRRESVCQLSHPYKIELSLNDENTVDGKCGSAMSLYALDEEAPEFDDSIQY